MYLRNKIFLMTLFVISLHGCGLNKAPVTNHYDSQGHLIRTTMQGDHYIDSQIAKAKSECQNQIHNARSNLTDATALVAITAIDALSPRDPCATTATSNDVKIVQTKERHKSFRFGLGVIGATIFGKAAVEDDSVVVEQPEPVIVEQPAPVIVEPTIVEPQVIIP